MPLFTIDVSELFEIDDFLRDSQDKLEKTYVRIVRKIGFVVERKVKRRARDHRRTGEYERSIRFRMGRGPQGTVTSVHPAAGFLEAGTAPHRILARPGGVLAFVSGGVTFFRKSVDHPGNPAYQIFEKGLEDSRGQIGQIIKDEMRKL